MSLWKWITTTNPPKTPGLPNPQSSETQEEAETTQAVNDAVDKFMTENPRKRKRGHYNSYDDETRAKIARAAVDMGISHAARKFSTQLGRPVNESTVRGMKAAYLKKVKENGQTSVPSLPKKPAGHPLLLGDMLDDMVKEWVKKV